MTYEEMCRYIVAKEKLNWEAFTSAIESRKQELTSIRQICFYFGHVFYKSMSYREMGRVFKKDHATVIHSVSVVKHDMEENEMFKRKINAYHERLRTAIYNDWPNEDDDADKMLEDTNSIITNMRIIAEAYCKMTGKKMIYI